MSKDSLLMWRQRVQVDPLMAERMATWVVWAVIHCVRRLDYYLDCQQHRAWPKLQLPDNRDVSVIVLGNGVMGHASAAALQELGVLSMCTAHMSNQQQACSFGKSVV